MTAILERSYEPIQPFGVDLGDSEETPQESGVMFHVVPESGRARWNHVEDLDSFFARMYHYHQKHGFTCMMLQETLELFQFIFVVVFSTFLFHCVDYSILFRDNVSVTNRTVHKISLGDAVLPTHECVTNFGALTWICILVAMIFWCLRVIKVLYHFFQFWDVKAFFNTALKISDNELDNLTWHEIQCRIRDVQKEQQMCIHKEELSELDIYHRILRFKNYMVAMVNKSLLPVHLQVPFVGEVVFLTRGLKYNIELLLFWGPWAPFENNWHLKEDYKKHTKRAELAQYLSKHILWVGVANLILCPLIFLWQILYSFFNYAEVIKREPGSLGSRCWSLYGRLYLRHFNELDHELNARLNRAYRPASKYMNIFTSPLMTILARNVAFVAGAFVAVLLILSIYDEDVITVEHVLTAITMLGAVVAGCRVFIPDENLVWCPEKLMTAVLAHVHYLPDSWRGQAHTHRVREEFSQLFQYKAVYLLEELLSPIITPYILCFHLRSKALDIVDFYRHFTVEVVGVGDVCSFAQMDVRNHGNVAWQTSVMVPAPASHPVGPRAALSPKEVQAEDGKTELSLVHFTLTNPRWQPPADSRDFVEALRSQAQRDAAQVMGQNALYESVHSMSSVGVTSILQSDGMGHLSVRGGLSRAEGPLHSERGLLGSLHQATASASLGTSVFGRDSDPLELTAADMSLSTLYLHELHRRQVGANSIVTPASDERATLGRRTGYQPPWQRPHHNMRELSEAGDEGSDAHKAAELTPLLDVLSKPFKPS